MKLIFAIYSNILITHSFIIFRIRVWSHSPLGVGSPSEEIRIDVPGAATRHSRDKAIAAGVVGGILFFIAAIVLSVCSVKLCNERKRRKAEKGKNCF